MATNYASVNRNTPYGSGDPYYNESTGYITPSNPPKKTTSNWIKIGIPVAVLIIVGAVVGGVLGSRASKNASNANPANPASVTSAIQAKNAIGVYPTGTDSLYMLPLYPATTNAAAFTTPTFISTSNAILAWPQDPFQPSNPSPTQVRSDRPRLIAPAYKWQALPQLIANDPYLSSWNQTIFLNASQFMALPPVPYVNDGGNGILDPARQIKQRMKVFSYVFRMTNDTKWADRVWTELQNAAGNLTGGWGPNDSTKWNPTHFLDTAELTAAYAIAYDWLYDQWNPDQLAMIRSTMIEYGLNNGVIAYNDANDPGFYGWWRNNTAGNWNCVCNNGLTMGSLAILGDDTTGIAQQLLSMMVTNALENCALGVSSDGTWSETNDYWYFGSTGHAELSSSLLSATGSTFNLLDVNPNFYLTGLFHMYSTGPGSLFNYGDTGPNKFSATANNLLFYGDQYNRPAYQLFQRDQWDAPDPWSMFWYNPTVAGAFWDGLALDHYFDNNTDQWASMRSSWTDENALFVAVKAGTLQNHQTHNDLDCGDFVVDALGTRWFGELGDGDYLSAGYFSNDTQDSERWLYYRKRTEGQNTILVDANNQNVLAAPSVQFQSSGEAQGSSTVYNVPKGSTAYFVADLTSAYFKTTSFSRGVRLINSRKQVLVQDEINASASIVWRAHTNATVTLSNNNQIATLTIGTETTEVQLLNPPAGAQFSTLAAVRLATDPPTPAGFPDQPNDGVTVLAISLPAGQYTLEVLMTPQWPGVSSSSYVQPSSVPLSKWSLTSHP